MERFIKNLARGAGAILREGFGKKMVLEHKIGFWDVVTQYDRAVDKFIVGRIKRRYPFHGIISEESGHSGKLKSFWIIDPLDGTRNFSRGIPVFCTSIAFVSGGRLEYGAIYEPLRDELFYAKEGRGAYLNHKRIRVSRNDNLDAAFCSVNWCIGGRSSKRRIWKLQELIVQKDLWNLTTTAGPLSLAYTAAGRFDFDIETDSSPWDYAAGAIIAKEAGAKVTDFKGRPYRWNMTEIVAANPVLHKKVIEFTRKI